MTNRVVSDEDVNKTFNETTFLDLIVASKHFLFYYIPFSLIFVIILNFLLFHSFTVHFNSLNFTHQLMHFYI